MGIFSNPATKYYNKAENAITQATQQQQAALSPYTQPAGTDFNNLRNAVYGGANKFLNTPNVAKGFTDYLKMSPNELLEEAMKGYQESPYETANRKAQEEAENHRLQSQGLYGSGAGNLEQSEIQQRLDEQYQNNYLGNLMKAFGAQGQVYDRYANARAALAKALGLGESQILGGEKAATSQLSSAFGQEGRNLSDLFRSQGQNATSRAQNLFHQLAGLGALGTATAILGPTGFVEALGLKPGAQQTDNTSRPDNNKPIGYGEGGTPLSQDWISQIFGG